MQQGVCGRSATGAGGSPHFPPCGSSPGSLAPAVCVPASLPRVPQSSAVSLISLVTLLCWLLFVYLKIRTPAIYLLSFSLAVCHVRSPFLLNPPNLSPYPILCLCWGSLYYLGFESWVFSHRIFLCLVILSWCPGFITKTDQNPNFLLEPFQRGLGGNLHQVIGTL